MTKPKPLSPSAQAVLDAAKEAYWLWDEMCPADPETIATASLRAAAEVFREAYANDQYLDHPDDFLFDIASELEGAQ